MKQTARCGHCNEPLGVIVVEVDLTPVLKEIAEVKTDLGVIKREMRIDMSEIDDKLSAEDTALTVLEADEARELADLQALKDAGQALTPDQEAKFDSLTARINAADAAIDSADPAPATPVDGTGDAGDTPAAQ